MDFTDFDHLEIKWNVENKTIAPKMEGFFFFSNKGFVTFFFNKYDVILLFIKMKQGKWGYSMP